MTRDFLQDGGPSLEGVVYDNGCSLSKYILNREAKHFEWMRTMVDGMHWSGHKKNRAGGKSLMGTLYVTMKHKWSRSTTFSLIPHHFFEN